ncbi:MAG: hypothetical protein AB7V50_07310 [Vampirovibrionia bacterium]
MTTNLTENLKNIDKLQGLIYQNLMKTFNELTENDEDYSDIGNITNVQKLKHVILSRLKTTTTYVNSSEFRVACVTCKAVRILGLLKHEIATKYLSEDEQKSALGEVISDYKVDKKYTESFYNTTQELKNNITKFISSKPLRKQFQLDNFTLMLIAKEKKLIEECFPADKEITSPEWIKELSEKELSDFASQVVDYLQKEDYEAFRKYTDQK